MTVGHYIEGIVQIGVVIISVALTSGSIRRKALSSWYGAPARLAELIIGISIVVVVSQALGTIGLFRTIPLVVVLAAVAVLTFRLGRNRVADATLVAADKRSSFIVRNRQETWWEPIAAVLAIGLVAAEWGAGTIHGIRNGVGGIDSIWYHMPVAARFVQTGSVIAPHNVNNDNVIEFYPYTSELLHAVGILLLGSDFLSSLINVLWLALALLAAWCLGRRYGVASLALMATALVLGTTEVVADEPGSAYNDIVGVALVLAALALLAYVDALWESRQSCQGLWVAALAAGLAVGVKDTFIFPVAALTVGVIALLPRGRRTHQGLLWCSVIVGMGGYWYARNVIYADNPVPNVHLGLGPIRLPSTPGEQWLTISHFLFDGQTWRTYFIPGLGQALGPAWLAIVLITAAGLIAGIVGSAQWWWRLFTTRGPRLVRKHTVASLTALDARLSMAGLLAFVGLATICGYVVTPQPNLPSAFVYDLRFSLLTFIAGLVALPIALGRSPWVSLLAPLYGAVMVATQFAGGIWSGLFGQSLVAYHSLGDGLLIGIPIVVLGLSLIIALRLAFRWFLRTALFVSSVLVVAAIVGGFPLQNFYLAHWYVKAPYPRTDRWASTVHHARIAVSGIATHYPFYGSDLTNDVEFVGTKGPRSTYFDVDTCPAWRVAINAGNFQYVVSVQDVLLNGKVLPSATTWMLMDPAAKVVVTDNSIFPEGYQRIFVFAIDGPMPISSCQIK